MSVTTDGGMRILCLAFAMAAVAGCADGGTDSTPTAGVVRSSATREVDAPNPTHVIDFQPQANLLAPSRPGSCVAASVAAPARKDAWRCSVGDFIADPCFSLDAGTLACGADPELHADGFVLRLTQPLPLVERVVVESRSAAWLIRLVDGSTCTRATGATGSPPGGEGKLATYRCDGGGWIVGEPVQGVVWMADVIRIDRVTGEIRVRELSPIESAWR